MVGPLVRENEWRTVGEGSRDRNALLLAATGLRRSMVASINQPDTVREFKRQPAVDSTPRHHGCDHVLDGSGLLKHTRATDYSIAACLTQLYVLAAILWKVDHHFMMHVG